MNALIPSRFSYENLPADQITELKAAATEIRRRRKQSVDDIIATGKELLKVKDRLNHGKWGKWLFAEFGWTDRTARRHMLAAEWAEGKSDIVSDLEPTALYQLSSPSTPAAVVEDVVDRLKRGERLTTARIKSMISKVKSEAKPKRQTAVAVQQVVEKAAEVASEAMDRSSRDADSQAAALIRWKVAGSEDALSQLLDDATGEGLLAALRKALTKPPMIDAVANRSPEDDPTAVARTKPPTIDAVANRSPEDDPNFIPPGLKRPTPARYQKLATADGAQTRRSGPGPVPDTKVPLPCLLERPDEDKRHSPASGLSEVQEPAPETAAIAVVGAR